MQIDHKQVALLAERLHALGVGRRVFLKVVGALTGVAAVGETLGWDTSAQAQGRFRLAPNSPKNKSSAWLSRMSHRAWT